MSEAAKNFKAAAATRVLDGTGVTSTVDRRAAFDNTNVKEPARSLIDKVTNNAYKVTNEDVQAAKSAGLSEDEIFELVVAAAIGQSTRQFDAAIAALDAATKDRP